MSTGTQVAVLDARGVRETRPQSELHPIERPVVRITAFAGLALYGALRWGSMLSPAPTWRLLALVAVAVAIAATGPQLRGRARIVLPIAAAVAFVAIFPLAGIPLAWVRHVRIAVTADAIDQGLSALPNTLVPYTGINEWVRVVIVLGAAVLLLDAAVITAVAPRPLSEARRAAAALPLIVLAIVPSTLARPQYPYLHGLILFALLAAFVWGERVARGDAPVAIGVAALAAIAAMIAAPALDQHAPWFNYQSLTGALAPGHVESFDWSQRYGPITWPRTGREILDVKAQRGDYWKTEDLDLFDGTGWAIGSTDYAGQPPAPAPALVAKYSQTLQVTLRAMHSYEVVGAGYSSAPQDVSQQVLGGAAPGTWGVSSELSPGDSYRIRTYSPDPSAAQLASAGSDYSAVNLQGDLTIELPGFTEPQVVFAPFGSHLRPTDVNGVTILNGLNALRASPYARAYALAQRLTRHAATPYAFVERVMSYLGHGYLYSENPPVSSYPIETFLFDSHAGYCQQFAGAMALLLRMGGVPARVATGFTTGTYDKTRHEFIVSDLDAHAWVEVWFPTFGWVRFDPTPAAAPARGGRLALLPALAKGSAAKPNAGPVRKPEPTPAATQNQTRASRGGGSAVPVVVAIIVVLVVLAVVLRSTVRFGEPDAEQLLSELERALARCGRPVANGVTLASIEHRFRDSPTAAQYVRALSMLRFGGGSELPTPAQRRALRTQLGFGLGVFGRLRALYALPPRWRPARDRPSGRLHSF
jgi:hypothetical protein